MLQRRRCFPRVFRVYISLLILDLLLFYNCDSAEKRSKRCSQWLNRTSERSIENQPQFLQQIRTINSAREGDQMGLIMCILNQRSGNLIFEHEFQLYKIMAIWMDLHRQLSNVAPERIVILHAEGKSILGIRNATQLISAFGSILIDHLKKDSVWSWVFINGGKTLLETVNKKSYGRHQKLHLFLPLSVLPTPDYAQNGVEKRRWEFCSKYGGIRNVCDELNPFKLTDKSTRSSEDSLLQSVPVIITAGKRMNYLFQSIKSFLRADGAIREMFHVLGGSYSEQTTELLKLLNINYTYIPPTKYGEYRFFSYFYYKEVFKYIAANFPNSDYAIILEEDVEVSVDFFNYMKQTIPLLKQDESLYCVTGFSFNSVLGLAHDHRVLYRGDTQVGWGYALTLHFIREMLQKWWDKAPREILYDAWIRHYVREERECIYPEVSRTIHFGIGLNTNEWIAERVFMNMKIPHISNINMKNVNDLQLSTWKLKMREKISEATPTHVNPCKEKYLESIAPGSYVIYYNFSLSMESETEVNFVALGTCFKIWVYFRQGMHEYTSVVKPSPVVIFYLVAHPQSHYSDLAPGDYMIFDIHTISEEEFETYNNYIQNENRLVAEQLPGNRQSIDLFKL